MAAECYLIEEVLLRPAGVSVMKIFLLLIVTCFALRPAAMAQADLSPAPAFALGQPEGVSALDPKHCDVTNKGLANCRPNLVEGYELNNPQSVAVDPSSGAVYVADTQNNRVLGWRDRDAAANGAKADIVIGQRDFYSTSFGGPGTSLQNGLNQPTAVAVAANGDLYVADAGNNRVLRFPRPFDQPEDLKIADLVIGQPNMFSRAANAGGLSASSLDLTDNRGAAYRTSLVFDGEGNLWFTDAGNNRVLRYPASRLGPDAEDGPAADLVIGQTSMEENEAPPRNADSRYEKGRLRAPSALAFDAGGRLYVADELLRVLVYEPPLVSAKNASRILGLVVVSQGQEPPPLVNERGLGVVQGNVWRPPEGVFTIGDDVFVVDTPANRIVRYPPFDEWPAETEEEPSPAAVDVIGLDSLRSETIPIHRGRAEPGADTLFEPVGVAVAPDNTVWVADSLNHRVLKFPNLTTVAGPQAAADKVLGQPGFANRTVNRIEGKEFFFVGNLGGVQLAAAGIAVDWQSDPPHLYVADPLNNRVLGFRDVRGIRNGARADLVLGQPGGYRSLVNYPTNDTLRPTQTGLFLPVGVAVDRYGNVYVADSGNGRVLRFPKPFEQPPGLQAADLVLGQPDFTSRVTDATARTMAGPWGLHFTAEGALLVSDPRHNRVLEFVPPFTSGMAASRVFGQPDFNSTAAGNALNRMNGPQGISADTSNRLYVADTKNNRILVFGDIRQAPPDPQAVVQLSGKDIKQPFDVFVSPATGKAWVANTNKAQVLRYRQFDQLLLGQTAPEFGFTAASPLALIETPFGNLLLADSLNRVVGHFRTLAATNGANFLTRIAPGMITSLFFPETPEIPLTSAQSVPLPTVLADVSVLVTWEGKTVAAPLYFVSATQINFQMPNSAPPSGTVEVTIVRPSTGQIVAYSVIAMDIASPGLFTRPPTGTGQIAALNEDNSINSAENPARKGEIVQIFATGQGFIPDAPPDGEPAPTNRLIHTPVKPRVFFNSGQPLPDADIQFSGLAPGLVGVWQINVKVPEHAIGGDNFVVVFMHDRPSGDPTRPGAVVTTIAVK